MSVRNATPYLLFNGHAREAIALYERALGAQVESISRFGDMDQSCPEARRDFVMHAALRVDGALIMMSDGPFDQPLPPTGIVSIALDLDDVEQAHRVFNALAEGGQTVQPLVPAPWGALFGALNDRFGVNWMFNVATA